MLRKNTKIRHQTHYRKQCLQRLYSDDSTGLFQVRYAYTLPLPLFVYVQLQKSSNSYQSEFVFPLKLTKHNTLLDPFVRNSCICILAFLFLHARCAPFVRNVSELNRYWKNRKSKIGMTKGKKLMSVLSFLPAHNLLEATTNE